MILDGNTEWSPDDVGEAIDAKATVSIGPVPPRSAGESIDAAGQPSGVGDRPDHERPPMTASPLFPADRSSAAPSTWIATGPLPSGDHGIGPLPTGSIPITDAHPEEGPLPPMRVMLQTAVVILAAGLVGLVVYGVLRSAAGAGDAGVSEESEVDRPEDRTVDPGPGDPGSSQDRLGSEQSDAGLRKRPSDIDDDIAAGGPERPQAGRSTTATAPADDARDSVGAQPGPAGPTTIANGSVTSSTAGVEGSNPSTSSGSNSAIPPGRPTSTVTSPTPTATTTATTATTSQQASTTTTSTTSTPTSPVNLIVAPAAGTVGTWESPLTLIANPVQGADRYCWTLSGTGGETTRCAAMESFEFRAGRNGPGPGRLTVTVEARAGRRQVVASQQISIQLLARDIISSPPADMLHEVGSRLRVSARRRPSADRYCWTFTQGATTSGPLCGIERTRIFDAGAPELADFGTGPVSLRLVTERNGSVIGGQTVGFDLVES